MAEYGAMFAISGIATILFLGGWHTGIPLLGELSELFGPPGSIAWFLGNVINVTVFIVKGWILVFVMMWVRWTLPRLRIDQVMMTCLKYLLPISCVLLLGVSLWMVLLPPVVVNNVPYALAGVSALLLLVMNYKAVTTPHRLPFQNVGDVLAPGQPPHYEAAAR